MKILHISHLYPPSIGGDQLHNRLLSEELAAMGHEVHVFTARARHAEAFAAPDPAAPRLAPRELLNGVRVRRFDVDDRLRRFLFDGLMPRRAGSRMLRWTLGDALGFWEHGPLVKELEQAIRRLRPDVMLAVNSYFFTALLAARARRRWKVPFVFMPSTHMSDAWRNHPALYRLFDAADRIVACTDFEKSLLARQGHDTSRISVIPLGVRPPGPPREDAARTRRRFGLGEGPVVAHFGRKVRGKGIEALIDAMRLVWPQVPEARLLLAGERAADCPASIGERLKRSAPAQRGRVVELDGFDEADKASLCNAIDVMAMPSNTDCFGFAYLEAWSAGKPVIACRGTPQESFVHAGRNGWLVDYNHPRDLAAGITKMLKREGWRRELGAQGRRDVAQNYAIRSVAGQYLREYERIARRPGRSDTMSRGGPLP